MIHRLQLIRNIGQFDQATMPAALTLLRLALAYAENGRGKTTLSAVLRSLATNRPELISERRRLSAPNAPEAIIDCDGGPAPAMFRNGAWNRTLPEIAIFDDLFVDENVYSGLVVTSDHRQRLHGLILGGQGVALNQQLQQLIVQIETHNTNLRAAAAAIPPAATGGMPIDEFCALPAQPDLDAAIQTAERDLAAARQQMPIRDAREFEALGLPAFDIAAVRAVLERDLPGLDAAAAARVQAHLARSGQRAEGWVAEGMSRIVQPAQPGALGDCPFCAQNLAGSPVIAHYRAYFSQEYSALKQGITDTAGALRRVHSGDAQANFERSVRMASERRQFWATFADMPEVALDTAAIAADWQSARDLVLAALANKQASPLERVELPADAQAAVATYQTHVERVTGLSNQLTAANRTVALVKERAAAGNVAALGADLIRLRAVQSRHEGEVVALCEAYLREKVAKAATEQQRDRARAAVEQYRENVFPRYEAAINDYLHRFNAGFRLGQVLATNTRGGPACTYNVVINNTPVSVGGGDAGPGQPAFRNTLSAGDRNALALAFFFASLDLDPGLAQKVVVVDDPISSLDAHRTLTTVQEIGRLTGRVAQVIVLSHSKPLLCALWNDADRLQRSAIQVSRAGNGSTIETWNVDQDAVTEYDRRHQLLRNYVRAAGPNGREVAEAIRPVLEGYCRVAYPEFFPAGRLLGPFRELCRQRVGTADQILSAPDVQELGDVVDYANLFHHDTNPAWRTVVINDGELVAYIRRALRFCARP